MARLREWMLRLWGTLRRDPRDREMEEELQAHLELAGEDMREHGGLSEDALRVARLRFGGVAQAMEAMRDQRGFPWFDDVTRDVRHALRSLRRSPGFTALAVLALALGIGANTALFSLIDVAFLRELSVEKPDELVIVDWTGPGMASAYVNKGFSYDTFKRFRDQSRALADVLAFAEFDEASLSLDRSPDSVTGQLVSGNYYNVLGLRAAAGRLITETDDTLGAEPVGVISYRYWIRRFAGDPGVVGKAITFNGVPLRIIGVSASGFDGLHALGASPDISIPLMSEPQVFGSSRINLRLTWWLRVVGRMVPGGTPEQVRASLEPVFQQSSFEAWKTRGRIAPAAKEPTRLRVQSAARGYPSESLEEISKSMPLLTVVFSLLLLIVCLNVSHLMIARSVNRQREIVIRQALGARPFRLLTQVLTESVLLSLIGGSFGVLIALWMGDILWALTVDPASIHDFTINLRILGVTAGISLAAGVVFGIAPALRALYSRPQSILRTAGLNLSRGRSWVSKSLLVVQVAMSVVLLISAGLLLRSIQQLHRVDVGFNAKDLLLFRVNPKALKYDDARIGMVYERIFERLEGIPGVRAVTASDYPLATNQGAMALLQGAGENNSPLLIRTLTVWPGFFQTMGVPVVLGRDFGAADRGNSPKFIVVNETLAKRVFAGANPVGMPFGPLSGSPTVTEIIGVAKDVRMGGAWESIPPTVFFSAVQTLPGATYFTARSDRDPIMMIPLIRNALRDVDGDLAPSSFTTQAALIENSFAAENTLAVALNWLGAAALLIVCIGLYGVMSFAVGRRTKEIGVRMALGARSWEIAWLVHKETLALILLGTSLGLVTSYFCRNLIRHLLFEVAPTDAPALLFSVFLMILVSFVASHVPARRAARLDPMVAIREN